MAQCTSCSQAFLVTEAFSEKFDMISLLRMSYEAYMYPGIEEVGTPGVDFANLRIHKNPADYCNPRRLRLSKF